MNKQTLITLAVIVGLLALWLLVAVLYPSKEAPEPTEPGMEDQASGGSSATVEATVTIVDSLDDVATDNEAALDARVTIE